MATERAILCGAVGENNLPCNDHRPLRLRLWGTDANVRLRVEDVQRAMLGAVPPTFLDLLDLATYVYSADQAIARGDLTDRDYGAGWRRRLFFRVPVRRPDVWNALDVRGPLVDTLSFLTDDEYHFQFEPLHQAEPVQSYFALVGGTGPCRPEAVALFSGGLDSLAGAVREAIVGRRQVVLVHHRSHDKLAPRLRQLLDLLREKAASPPLFVPVQVNKRERLSRESTQRSRSFLFTALGATLAVMLRFRRLQVYENGVVSINLPLSSQVVGARASRTTHPRVLQGLSRLIGRLVGEEFRLENPFNWSTKREVVDGIAEAGCASLIQHTTSCSHPRELTKTQTHCGRCSQCIGRRFAVLAAGLEYADPAHGYKVDLLLGERAEGQPRTMISAYVETATQIARMDLVRFLSRFGEASRVLRHAGVSPPEAASRVMGLYQRHAKDVCGVVEEAIIRHRGAILRRELPPSCLIRLVCDASGCEDLHSPRCPGSEPDPPPNVFRRRGALWEVRFRGGTEFFVRAGKGAAYLHLLLASPRKDWTAAELAWTVAQEPRRFALGDAGEAADREALSAYRARYEEATELLEAARRNEDPGTVERWQHEIEAIAHVIKGAKGLGKRLRKASDDRERTRKAVQGALHRAVEEIATSDQALAEHLSPPRLTCGHSPRYDPGDDVCWETGPCA